MTVLRVYLSVFAVVFVILGCGSSDSSVQSDLNWWDNSGDVNTPSDSSGSPDDSLSSRDVLEDSELADTNYEDAPLNVDAIGRDSGEFTVFQLPISSMTTADDEGSMSVIWISSGTSLNVVSLEH